MKIIFILILISQCLFSQINQKYFDDGFLDSLQLRTFNFFWKTTDHKTGLVLDRYPTKTFSSIAAIGFGLTAYGIGVERNYIKREEAAERVLNTLKFLYSLPQNSKASGIGGYKGFFYHFLNLNDGTRFKDVELSSIDTGLLMMGVLFSQSYFSENNKIESEIRSYADSLYRRIDWNWMSIRKPKLSMGWHPEKGFLEKDWIGYYESAFLYILALGSPTNKLTNDAFDVFMSTSEWLKFYNFEYVSFGPLFGHQYSQCWIDFRGIQDKYMSEKGIDYFENSRRATYANREYAKANPKKMKLYSDLFWGITACDGPADIEFEVDGVTREFISYAGRGVAADLILDDGTLAPTAAGGSIAFAPEICYPTLKALRNYQNGVLYKEFGFIDSFNPTFVTKDFLNGWVDEDYLGIDQGPIVIMIENLRTEFVWNVMKKNKYIVTGLRNAGFHGGWLVENQN